MERVLVVTHPEATHHVDRVVGGWFDSSLTERGLRRAAEIAAYVRAAIPRDAEPQLVTSDLLRTRQTADAIGAELGVVPALDADLREKSYGVAGGRPQAWLDERFIPPPAAGDRLGHVEGIDGAETMGRCVARVYAAVARLTQRPAAHRVVVTHGGTAGFVIAAWLRIPAAACSDARFRVPPGSVSVLELDDRYHNRSLVALGVTDLAVGSPG
ncbi:MAG: histidine phosphatase family protein [Salana multivorans]|uniref:histidine phosphatase family protein n=1 Tax=Salana multivorans TaxID=120377 RepID=UPI00095C8731|nr:histidine phosphatase family protein [Salana multivorans]MBN8882700.1 histidine phosphatase family protein [Salana multivorans]OJX94437.1 MAG: histidine phosphatase family protein [Micrococcales bacterium 73-15]